MNTARELLEQLEKIIPLHNPLTPQNLDFIFVLEPTSFYMTGSSTIH